MEVLPAGVNSPIDLEWVADNISDEIFLVSVTHKPSCAGFVNPIESLGQILKNYNTFYVVDACQTVGYHPLDIKAIHCDLLSAAGRKFLSGPRGSAFAFVSTRLRSQLTFQCADLHAAKTDGHTAEIFLTSARVLEFAERGLSSIAGFHQAVESFLESSWAAPSEAYDLLSHEIGSMTSVEVIGKQYSQSAILSFFLKNHDADVVVDVMRHEGVNLWVGDTSHTPLLAAHLGKRFVRVSVARNITCSQVESALAKLKRHLVG